MTKTLATVTSPYAPQSKWLLVLKRPGDRPLNHDNNPGGDIIRFAPVSIPHLAPEIEAAMVEVVMLPNKCLDFTTAR